MFGISPRAFTRMTVLATAATLASTAQAQFFNGCNSCATPVVAAPIIQSAACPCMQPVSETVYQDVQQVTMIPEQRTVKVAKVITEMQPREVTTYQTVTETRTAEVPSYINQTVTECQAVTSNQSYWRTQWQPIPKFSPCQYDNRPGLMGEFNRMGIAMRNSFSPNYTARREFVPNVVTAQVPVQRTVQVPTTRQVTYNVAKVVPVTSTAQVPVQRVVYEDTTVTAMVPSYTTKRVAVGTRTRMAYVDPYGGSTTSASAGANPTAAQPTPSKTSDKGATRPLSSPSNMAPPIVHPTHQQPAPAQPTPVQPSFDNGPVAGAESADAVEVAGWRPARSSQELAPTLAGPELSVAKK